MLLQVVRILLTVSPTYISYFAPIAYNATSTRSGSGSQMDWTGIPSNSCRILLVLLKRQVQRLCCIENALGSLLNNRSQRFFTKRELLASLWVLRVLWKEAWLWLKRRSEDVLVIQFWNGSATKFRRALQDWMARTSCLNIQEIGPWLAESKKIALEWSHPNRAWFFRRAKETELLIFNFCTYVCFWFQENGKSLHWKVGFHQAIPSLVDDKILQMDQSSSCKYLLGSRKFFKHFYFYFCYHHIARSHSITLQKANPSWALSIVNDSLYILDGSEFILQGWVLSTLDLK